MTTDWKLRVPIRAQSQIMVKCSFRKYCYPPDEQEKATQAVLEQAALIAKDWTV